MAGDDGSRLGDDEMLEEDESDIILTNPPGYG
jgi:hypothetical protein